MFANERKLDSLNRVVVPPEVRAILGLHPGDALVFVARNGRVELQRSFREETEGSADNTD